MDAYDHGSNQSSTGGFSLTATPSPVSLSATPTHTVVTSFNSSPPQTKTTVSSFSYQDVNTHLEINLQSQPSPVKLTPMSDDFDLRFYSHTSGIAPIKSSENDQIKSREYYLC